MLILGLNMFHADASAAIVLDGEVMFAIAEERLNRHKHFGGFPALVDQSMPGRGGGKDFRCRTRGRRPGQRRESSEEGPIRTR